MRKRRIRVLLRKQVANCKDIFSHYSEVLLRLFRLSGMPS